MCVVTCCLLGQRLDRFLNHQRVERMCDFGCCQDSRFSWVVINRRNLDWHENDSVHESGVNRPLHTNIGTNHLQAIKSVENRKELSGCPTAHFSGAGCCNATLISALTFATPTCLKPEYYMSPTNLVIHKHPTPSHRHDFAFIRSEKKTLRTYQEQRWDPKHPYRHCYTLAYRLLFL